MRLDDVHVDLFSGPEGKGSFEHLITVALE